MIERQISAELKDAAREYPTVTVFGPRQSGKTTLARMVFPDKVYRSLEDPDIRAAAQVDPRGFLADLREGAILDEIQRTRDSSVTFWASIHRNKRSATPCAGICMRIG